MAEDYRTDRRVFGSIGSLQSTGSKVYDSY